MGTPIRLLALAGLVSAAVGCGDVIRQGRSPVIVVVNSILAIRGNGGPASTVLLSDVQTLVRTPLPCTPASPCPTVFNDYGRATFSLAMKNITVTPTTNNQVQITRYTVRYRRNDGRNVEGIDIPYPFDGAVTATISIGPLTEVAFELVRHVAKEESPLVQLINNPNIITTIAEVTFYGSDLTGNAVTATGSLVVEFGNFGDF